MSFLLYCTFFLFKKITSPQIIIFLNSSSCVIKFCTLIQKSLDIGARNRFTAPSPIDVVLMSQFSHLTTRGNADSLLSGHFPFCLWVSEGGEMREGMMRPQYSFLSGVIRPTNNTKKPMQRASRHGPKSASAPWDVTPRSWPSLLGLCFLLQIRSLWFCFQSSRSYRDDIWCFLECLKIMLIWTKPHSNTESLSTLGSACSHATREEQHWTQLWGLPVSLSPSQPRLVT